MPARTVAEKSRSGSASMRIATPSPSEKMTSTTASGAARSAQHARLLLRAQELGQALALAAQQLRELRRDLLVAPRQREQLEDQRDEAGLVADEVVERRDEPRHEVVGRARVCELLVEQRQAHVAVAPHDLDEQPLLRAEVVVQEPARHASRARDLIERRARRTALADRRAHRVDDPRRLVAGELALAVGCRFHAARSVLASRPGSTRARTRPRTTKAPRRAPSSNPDRRRRQLADAASGAAAGEVLEL